MQMEVKVKVEEKVLISDNINFKKDYYKRQIRVLYNNESKIITAVNECT